MTSTTTVGGAIAVVDFSSLSLNRSDPELDETSVQRTVAEMMSAFSTTGFVYLSNTGFNQQLVYPTNHDRNNKRSSALSPTVRPIGRA